MDDDNVRVAGLKAPTAAAMLVVAAVAILVLLARGFVGVAVSG